MLINVFLSSELTPFLVRFYSFFLCVIFVNGFIQRSGATRGLGLKTRGFSVKHKFPKYKTIFKFSLMPKSRVTAVMGRLFCRNYDYPQSFHASLAKSNFHVSVFLIVISAYYFQLFTFKFLRKTFQVSVRRFRLSRFSFSSVYCQIPTFRLLLATPIFTLLLCKLLAETTAYFLIVFICVISAQLPYNVKYCSS